MKARRFLWVGSNIFGYVFGRPSFAMFNKVMAQAFLHALGYDNMFRDSWTGEDWFVRAKLAPTNPTVCVDVGANVGNYTKQLLKYTKAKVYAIEPLPVAFAQLQTLGDRVTPINTAVAEMEGEAPLFHSIDVDTMASLDRSVRRGAKQTVVKVQPLYKILAAQGITHVDFLKIDTEGNEEEVLKTLGGVLPSFVQFEFNINHLFKSCTLYKLSTYLPGYTFYRLLPHGWVQMNPKKYIDNVFMYCNVIAVRP